LPHCTKKPVRVEEVVLRLAHLKQVFTQTVTSLDTSQILPADLRLPLLTITSGHLDPRAGYT
jgi:hypothetical protein